MTTNRPACCRWQGLRILAAMVDPKLLGDEALARIRHRLAARIDEMGISVAKLARRSGVSSRTIHRLLSEPDRDVYVRTIAALSAVLLIDVQALLEPLPEAEPGEAGEGEGAR